MARARPVRPAEPSPPDGSPAVGHDDDFYLWTREQAAALRRRRTMGLDWENLAEEIESLGRRDRRELRNRLRVLLAHLLKWRFQPERRGASRSRTLRDQRAAIDELLIESSSLRHRLPEMIAWAYPRAAEDAAEEAGLPRATFPDACLYTPDDVLSDAFLPAEG